jgi:hypothetical protein
MVEHGSCGSRGFNRFLCRPKAVFFNTHHCQSGILEMPSVAIVLATRNVTVTLITVEVTQQ